MKDKISYKILRYGLLSMIVLMPFHAFLTTWLAGNSDYLLWVRAWKEVVLAALFLIGLYYFIADKKLRATIWGRTINKLILTYGLWLLFVSVIASHNGEALAQGLAINMRFLTVFVLMQIVLFYQPVSRKLIYQLITVPAVGVVVFGLMQMFILPRDFLTHFNYSKKTSIPPYFTIDEQLTSLRWASTLTGPNTLGAYLVLPILLIFQRGNKLLTSEAIKKIIGPVFLFAGMLIVMYGTHSRSAWLALAVSFAVYVILSISKKWRTVFIIFGSGLMLIAGLATYQYRDTQFVQDVILHDDPVEGGEVSSNLGHIEAMQSGAEDIIEKPLIGCGVGCAGPASARTKEIKISENYYLQIGQEAGVVGAGLFITLIVLVGRELYKKRQDSIAIIMLASLVGLSVSNLLLHTWADDTLAIIWWSVAAVAIYSKAPQKTSKSDLNPI